MPGTTFCSVSLVMQAVYELAPVIGEIIAAHRPRSHARDEFMRACWYGHWDEAVDMAQSVLAEPQHLRGYQGDRLREFLELTQVAQDRTAYPASIGGA
jgi:hypothetical protein